MTLETDTIIVGAGPAGLAVGAALRRADQRFVMLERSRRVGESWHHHYERLHLHTPKRHSALPYKPFPRDYPTYPSRRQVIEYLEEYARAFDLKPEFGSDVRTCTRDSHDHWIVSTDSAGYRARNVVMTTGLSRVPNVPPWPGQETFPGPIVHSREYTNGERFRGQRVLVVGFGNTGAEIALDLIEHGARCAIAVRGKVNVVPRDFLGVPVIVIALLCHPLPPRVADAMTALTRRLAVGNLATAGLEERDEGPITSIVEAKQVPVIDIGTLARIRNGDIDVRKGLESFAGAEVRFTDGRRDRFDAIVLATGYTSGLASIFADHDEVLDGQGIPRVNDVGAAAPGLYFCGFDVSKTRGGLLRRIGFEAERIARDVSERRSSVARQGLDERRDINKL
jgi:indole-3-pyruvate monooxygenase